MIKPSLEPPYQMLTVGHASGYVQEYQKGLGNEGLSKDI